MSELKTTSPNDPTSKKSSIAPRSTKTSRAREVYLQKHGIILPTTTSSTTSTSTTAPIPKPAPTKKAIKTTPTPSFMSTRKVTPKSSTLHATVKSTSFDTTTNTTIANKEVVKEVVKHEIKFVALPPGTQGDVADDDFEIVQINEIKENHSFGNSPRVSEEIVKPFPDVPGEEQLIISEQSKPTTPHTALSSEISSRDITPHDITPSEFTPRDTISRDITPRFVTPRDITPRDITPRPAQQEINSHLIETEAEIEAVKKSDEPEHPKAVITDVNPCDAPIQSDSKIVEELEKQLLEKEEAITTLDVLMKETNKELKLLEEKCSIRLNDLTKRLEDSEQKLEKSIEECNQHKFWVESTETQLNSMRHKYVESEQKLMAQEEDLKRLLRWSNIKNASIVTCAATAFAYYHVKK